tara:strand:- start:267 stop:632 length:366 start_codon:yes stop_codon:yes gene_type:complete
LKISFNWILLTLGFYFVISIFQITAVTDSLLFIFNIDNTFFEGITFIFSIFLTFTPVLGPVLGILGATLVWGWNILFAVLLFFWPYLFLLLGMFFSSTKKTKKKKNEDQIVDAEIVDEEKF